MCRNEDLQPIFAEYEKLSAISGLMLNAEKTEVFNLIQSPINSNRIMYRGISHLVNRVDKIIICGMCIASEPAIEYQHNVLNRLTIMEGIVESWGRRHLTMNGRMLLAKTFLLSQVVFPAQFTLIGTKEVKKIERLIYAFVNGARNLYGPEHISRRYLKAERTNGGINGIDVSSFVTAIAMRQFGKADQFSSPLRSLQASVISPKDDICKVVSNQLKSGMVKFLRNNPIPDIPQLDLISSFPISILLKQSSIAANLVVQHDLVDL